ncbi:hypothetical protein [Microbacterium sp.]|uniref:hypothetical protein n=1 Tax=Microbacterium sp. TaxID=51671 RepID=UPI003919DB8F
MVEKWFQHVEADDFDAFRDLGAFVSPARSYVLWRWYKGDGGRIEKDDLISYAHVALVELANAPDGEFRRHPGRFWAAAKQAIDWRVQRVLYEREGAENVRSDHYDEIEGMDPADSYTQLRIRQEYSLLQVALAEAIAVLPRRHKIILALRFFEQSSLGKMGAMIGSSDKPPFNYVAALCAHLLWCAKREVSERGELDRPPLPRIRAKYEEPLERAAAEAAARYGMDADTWLGWVQRSYVADVSCLVDIVNTANGHMIHYTQPKVDRAADVEYVETMDPAPRTIGELRERTGWGWPRCTEALTVWRRRHGIETLKNGHAAVAA